jgi:hypothetical protein
MFYVNIGINEPGESAPKNMSHPVVPPFQLVGPNNLEYPGQFCLPQIGMPKNLDLQVGTNITIQVIELAQHGAALYNVRSALMSTNQPQGCHEKKQLTRSTIVRRRHTQRARRSRGNHQRQLLQQLYLRLQPRLRHYINDGRSAECGFNGLNRGSGSVRGCGRVDG